MPSQIQLSISAQGASDDEISAITKDVAAWINEAAPQCEVEQQTEAGPEGAKGIIDILGSLGVRFLEHGALASLINCLTVYIKERRREITITLKTPAGGSVELKSRRHRPARDRRHDIAAERNDRSQGKETRLIRNRARPKPVAEFSMDAIASVESKTAKRALLVGVAHYDDQASCPNLRTPNADVEAMKRVLERPECGFTVTTLSDPIRTRFASAIEEMFEHGWAGGHGSFVFFRTWQSVRWPSP